MTDSEIVEFLRDGRRAECRVRISSRRDADDRAVVEALERTVDWIEDGPECDVLVFRLAGSHDSPSSVSPDVETVRKLEKVLVRLEGLRCISIALVDGRCQELALQLALACDHRVLTSRASIRIVELKRGYLPGMNAFRLAKYAGIGVARRLIFLGQPVPAAECAALGLCDLVCEVERMDEALSTFIEQLQPVHGVAAQLARRLLNESFSSAFEGFIGQYLASQHRCLQLQDRTHDD